MVRSRLIARSQAVVLATHDLAAARRLCTRGLVLDSGRLVFDGPIEAATQAYADRDPAALTYLFELLRYPLVLQTTTTLCIDLALRRSPDSRGTNFWFNFKAA